MILNGRGCLPTGQRIPGGAAAGVARAAATRVLALRADQPADAASSTSGRGHVREAGANSSGSGSSNGGAIGGGANTNRRALLAGAALLAAASLPAAAPAAAATAAVAGPDAAASAGVERLAYEAYANRDFSEAVRLLNSIEDRADPRWLEMRAQVLVDGKAFEPAVADYTAALRLCEDAGAPLTTAARLRAGRALALEGLSDWRGALEDYNAALELAARGGESLDPYVLNSRGNCHNSLQEWAAAREDYLKAADVFQASRGFRGPRGGTTARLDGAIFAASNAALMLAEMGDVGAAEQEMRKIARRAPGSSDMRVALAALMWRRGDEAGAEEQWQFACDQISAGCRKYQDPQWLATVRRWPPSMRAALSDFLSLQRGAAAA